MIVGVGVDIVDIKRIADLFSDAFLQRILTMNERELMRDMVIQRQIEFVAGRFAAKEAIIKALPIKLHLSDVEVLYNEHGAPSCMLEGYTLLVSIAHEHDKAIAYALALKEENHD